MQAFAERVARLEYVVLQEFEGRTMDRVSAGFGVNLNHRAAGLSKLGVVVARGHLEFLYRIQVGIHHDNAQHRVVIIRSINHEIVHAKELAIGIDLYPPLRIFTGSVLPVHFTRTG